MRPATLTAEHPQIWICLPRGSNTLKVLATPRAYTVALPITDKILATPRAYNVALPVAVKILATPRA